MCVRGDSLGAGRGNPENALGEAVVGERKTSGTWLQRFSARSPLPHPSCL